MTPKFAEIWAKIKDHVVAVNVTGIDSKGDEVYPSQGDSDMMLMPQFRRAAGTGRSALLRRGGDAEKPR